MENRSIEHPVILYILKHWIINICTSIIICVGIFIYVFFYAKKEYTSKTTVIPNAANFSQGLSGQLSALSSLAGVNLATSSGQSQEMFRGILTSQSLLVTVLFDTFDVDINNIDRTGRLIDFLELNAQNSVDSIENAIKMMNEKVIDISIDNDNDILSLSITLCDPLLSSEVANRMIIILDDIVQNRVQKEYHEQLNYLQKRLIETENDMTVSEENLKRFLEKVKNYTEPKNQIEELRLRRALELQTVIYTELHKQMETFIIQNMINLSHVKVLDKAIPPFRKSRPKRVLLLISLGMLEVCCQIGLNAGVLMIRRFKRDYARQKSALEC